MPYGAHETMEVHEMLNEKINLINHFSWYAQMCQDKQLRDMIDRHLWNATQSYDQLVMYTHDYGAAQHGPRVYGMPNVAPRHIQYGLHNPGQQMPQTQGRMNDQQIASSMLYLHKNSACNQMRASLECADPNIRQMLMNGAITCANQAYEVFLFMNHNGMYQVPTMNDHTAKTYLHSYQPMQEGMGAMSGMGPMSGMSQSSGMGQAGADPISDMRGMNVNAPHMGNLPQQ